MAQYGGNPSRYAATIPTEKDLVVVADRAGSNWSRLLTNLGIPWTIIEDIKAESSTNLWEACMKGLVMWLKWGASDSNEPVTFGTLFAALEDSAMEGCVSRLLVDRLDKRSTPHPRPTHEDKDEDLSTPPSERGKQLTVINAELLQEVRMSKEQQSRMGEELALLQRERDNAMKVGGEKEKDTVTQLQEKDTQLREKDNQLQAKDTQLRENVTQLQAKDTQIREKDSQIAKLLEEIQRLKQESPASSICHAKPFKPGQTKVSRSDSSDEKVRVGPVEESLVSEDLVFISIKDFFHFYCGQFKEKMATENHIVERLYSEDVISSSIRQEIRDSADGKTGNLILYGHMVEQGDYDSTLALCTVMTSNRGYRQMKKLGEVMTTNLEKNRERLLSS